MRFAFLEHTADVKFQAYGATKEEAFSNAAVALFEVMCQTASVKPAIKKTVQAHGEDEKALLVRFLEELIFLLDTQHFLLHDVSSLALSGKNLVAEVTGDAAAAYQTRNEVKAVTYNDMFIEEKEGKVTVQVVVDV